MTHNNNNNNKLELPLFYNINSHGIFNILQDIGSRELIIDLRSKEQYNKNHIKTSVNISQPELITTGEEFNLSNYITTFIKTNWNSVFQKVIIYSDIPFNIDEVEEPIEDTQTTITTTGNWEQIITKHLISNRKKVKILINQDGFNSFQQSYPFMCICSQSTNTNKFQQPLYPSEIIENFMYLGGQDNAASDQQINNLKITHIVNMASELKDVYPTIYKYYRADLDDASEENIYNHFEPCIDFINNAKNQGGRVLVHCAMGRSRSSTMVIAYLMTRNELSFTDALKYCRSKRSITNPNFGFVKQLKEYQVHLEKLKQIDNVK